MIDWDNASSSWINLIGYDSAYLGLTWTQTGTTPGSTYSFRIKVQNAQGWSDYSEVTAVLAATIPTQPEVPVVSALGI